MLSAWHNLICRGFSFMQPDPVFSCAASNATRGVRALLSPDPAVIDGPGYETHQAEAGRGEKGGGNRCL